MRLRMLRLAVACTVVPLSSLMATPDVLAEPLSIRWILVHEPSEVVEQAAQDFATRVARDSNGELRVEILHRSEYGAKYGGGKPVTEARALQDVESGKVEMCQVYTAALGSYEHDLWALGMPYLFRDDDHAERVIEGSIGARLMDKLQTVSNMRALAITYSGGPKIIATKDAEARRPADLAGLRLMFGSSPVSQSIAQQWGVEAYHAPAEGFAALADNGLLDGVETTPARFAELEQYRAANVVINTGHALLTTMIVINKDFYKRLPPKYQTVVSQAAREAGRMERRLSLEANQTALRTMPQQHGVKVIELSADENRAFEKSLRAVYDTVGSMVSPSLIVSIREAGRRTVAARP